MNTIINRLLEISITSSILISVVLIIRKLFKNRISAAIQYSIWLLVALRLLMPISIPSPASVMNMFSFNKSQTASEQAADGTPLHDQTGGTELISDTAVNENFVKDGNNIHPKTQAADDTIRFDRAAVIVLVWIIGILCTASYMAFINVTYLKRIIKNSVEFPGEKLYLRKEICTKLEINKNIPVIVNDAIPSPCLIGWFNPKIVVTPQALENEKTIYHVFLHELCHYKQRDNWIAFLRNMCCAVYWFNPLVWAGAVVSRADAELACDERVLRYLAYDENTDYGETLLKLIPRSNLSISVINTSTTMSMGGKRMNERINQIVNPPKTIKLAAVGVIAILLAVSRITLSGAVSMKADDSTNGTTIEGYADLEKISNYETLYVGDASTVGAIVGNLPQPSAHHIQNMFSLQTDSEPYGLTVYYEYNEYYTGAADPFQYSKMDNNALILFAFIDNLDYITFAYRNTPSNGELKEDEYIGILEYVRSDFIQRFGDFTALKNDLAKFNAVLLENLKIDPFRIHYNRISFEDTYEWVIYRNGEPDEIIRNDDNSYAMVYKYLGVEEHYSPDGEFVEAIPGNDVTIYLDGNGIQGVYAAYIKGSSEIISDSLGIESDLTYSGITKKLGKPQLSENNNATISYQLFNYSNRYVTFHFDEHGNLESHGFYTGYNPLVLRDDPLTS